MPTRSQACCICSWKEWERWSKRLMKSKTKESSVGLKRKKKGIHMEILTGNILSVRRKLFGQWDWMIFPHLQKGLLISPSRPAVPKPESKTKTKRIVIIFYRCFCNGTKEKGERTRRAWGMEFWKKYRVIFL